MSADTSLASVQIQLQDSFLRLVLPTITAETPDQAQSWLDLEQALKNQLRLQDKTWAKNHPVHLVTHDRLLDTRQLQAIADILQDVDLDLQWVETQRRQTAVAAASAGYCVEQSLARPPLVAAEKSAKPIPPLLLKNTLRSGVIIRHGGDVILFGDVNPGSEIIAEGDILIWGTLRGTAHAGVMGNQDAVIMILRLAPSQIRIADVVARVSSDNVDQGQPEVAHITAEGIRLSPARGFKRTK